MTAIDTVYRATRAGLFRLDPEQAHHLSMRGLSAISTLVRAKEKPSVTRVMGIDFPSRVGLAAGMDKDGTALRAWPLLGFGFVEVGTVTAQAQPGNSRPRLFRYPQDQAIINRMGFNNLGSAALAQRLQRLGPLSVPLGISLGKSKSTAVADAVEDYLTSLRRVYPFASYIAVNVSSPNTPGLRTLQDAGALTELVRALVATSGALADSAQQPVPIAVKVAPDLGPDALAQLVDVCLAEGVSGIIATNTTLDRAGLPQDPAESGGLSGAPLTEKSLAVVRSISAQAGERLPIIGVGGIGSADDAQRFLDAGASLVQLYSALVFQGPGVVRRISRAIDRPASIGSD